QTRAATVVPAGLQALNYEADSSYDANNKVTSVQVQRGAASEFSTVSYGYDALDRKITETVDVDGAASRTTRFLYDAEGRLKGKILPTGGASGYKYDAAGRQTESRLFAARSTDGVTLPTASNNDAVTSTTYDGEGNILSVRDPNGAVTVMLYDGYGRRIETS